MDKCKGGNPFKVFEYINKNGIHYQNNYSYKNSDQTCQIKIPLMKFKPMKPIQYFFVTNPVELIKALNKGPVVVIHHVNKLFKSYTAGIFNDPNCKGELNHAGLAVGYDISHKIPHILIKNAWGSQWGENGYYKLALGDVTKNNKSFCNLFDHDANVIGII